MGRHNKLKETRFRIAHRKAKTVLELAALLEVSVPTVYTYCRKLNLSLPNKSKAKEEREKLTIKIFKAYRGLTTLEDLGTIHGLSRTRVRQCLKQYLLKVWKTSAEKDWPLPRKLCHIKIVHALIRSPKLFDDPEKIAKSTNLCQKTVMEYLQYTYEQPYKFDKGKKDKEK